MAYISYEELWQSDFDNIVFKKERVQDSNINQLKLQLHDSFKKDENKTTIFKAANDERVINKAYLDEILLKLDGHLSLLEKNYNEYKILSDKQSIEEVLSQRAVKLFIQILHDKELFDTYDNADEVLKIFCSQKTT